MYYDDNSEYCKRCKKLFYLSYYNDDESGLCPKCKEYFKKYPEKYKIFTGEYFKCENCGELSHRLQFEKSIGVCKDCKEKFEKHPGQFSFFKFKRKFRSIINVLLNKTFFVLFWILFIAVCLFIAYCWIAGMIDSVVNLDDSFLYGPRMVPD